MADTPQQEPAQDFEGQGIQEIISKYLPYWPIFVGLMAIGAVIAYIKLRKATPIYQAHASIIIKNEEQGDAILQQLNGSRGGGYKSLENEIYLLKSRPIARDIARNLHLYSSVTEEGRVRRLAAYTTSPVVFRMQNPDSIKPVGQVYFTFNAATQTVTFNGETHPLSQYFTTPWGNMIILANPYATFYTPPNPMYFSLNTITGAGGMVQGELDAKVESEEASVVELTCDDESPQRAEDILNELVRVYNKAAIDNKNKIAENTLKFLDQRLALVQDDLDSIESGLERFRAANRILDISAQGNQYLNTVSANDQQLARLDVQLAVLDKVQQYVGAKEREQEAPIPALGAIEDPILSGQIQRLYTAESQLAQQKAITGANFPTVKALQAEINTLRPTLQENLRNQRLNLQVTRSNLNANNGKYNSLLSALPAQERALLNINRQQQIKNTIYTFLLQRREETALSFASTVSDSRLVNDAQAGGVISPVTQNVYLQWIVSAFVLGAIFVFVRENLNRNVKSKAEAEKLTAVPIIAEIAQNNSKEAIVIQSGNRSLIAEQFRYLRTSLNYVGINTGQKRILFTSSISGEGKSFITTNLGATLASAGKKVIMLEMDLRKPKLSEMLGIDRTTGLSDYLIGAKSVSEIIKPTTVSNLSLISSGAIPPNPAEILLSTHLPELLQHLEASYDYILIDTAPVSPVTDAYIISPLCDATIYVVRQGRTPRVLLQKLNDILRSKRLKNISIVFNGVKQRRFGSYYGYGYTYGYGYLDEKKGKKIKSKS